MIYISERRRVPEIGSALKLCFAGEQVLTFYILASIPTTVALAHSIVYLFRYPKPFGMHGFT
jgi:hypothetical protein